jgi:predicted DNA-binding transcriptional regulator YafY
MKFPVAVRLLSLMPTRPEAAITVQQIVARWPRQPGKGDPTRNIQRYVAELADGVDGQPLLEKIERGEPRYYLRLAQVANWLMTEETALGLLMSQRILGEALGQLNELDAARLSDLADQVAGSTSATKRLRQRLRIVPDGVGRLPAKIDQAVLRAAIDAIGSNRQFIFGYKNQAGRLGSHTVSPQGLVAKDGTIYLVATRGFADQPFHYALHRMSSPEVANVPGVQRPEFDLDHHIRESHQLGHLLSPKLMQLRLAVDPAALFHFVDRPLSSEQTIEEASGPRTWPIVSAKIPDTMVFRHFVLSLWGQVEVLEPVHLREDIAHKLKSAASLYFESAAI